MKVCPTCKTEFSDDANFCPEDAAKLVSSGNKNEFGDRFQTTEQVSEDGLGDVFAATDTTSGTRCTVTKIKQGSLAGSSQISKVERELKQLEKVSHTNICSILGYGKTDATVWFATELHEGQTLHEQVSKSGPMPAKIATETLQSVIAGIAEAAKVGVIHRDLSPQNILMTSVGPKITNFAAPVVHSGGPNGVPEYVAPEQIDGKPVDQRSNIYSLGALFYFMVTGQAPYQGDRDSVLKAHKAGNPTPPSAVGAGSNAEIDAIVLKALQVSSSKRYMTLRQFLDAVAAVSTAVPSQKAQAEVVQSGRGKNQSKGNADMSKTIMGMGAADIARLAEAAKNSKKPDATAEAAEGQGSKSASPDSAKPKTAPPQGSKKADAAPARSPKASPPPPISSKAPGKAPPSKSSIPAPVLPATAAKAASAGKGKNKGSAPEAKPSGRKKAFRETLWFKKGELDEVAAEQAARAAAQGRDDVAGTADSMPIEDRYNDDGSLSNKDQRRLSLKTGETLMTSVSELNKPAKSDVSEAELLAEMRGNQKWIVVGVVLLATIIMALVLVL